MLAVVLTATVALVAVAWVGIIALGAVASAQSGFLLDDADRLRPGPLAVVLLEVGLPVTVMGLTVLAGMLAGLSKLSDDALQRRPRRVRSALARGVRRAPSLSGGLILGLLTVVFLTLATPVFMAAGALGLIATPFVRLAMRRWGQIRWPSLRTLVLLAIPLAIPASMIVRWGLVVPAAALERNRPRAALDRSRSMVRSAGAAGVVTLLTAGGFYVALSIGVDGLRRTDLSDLVLLVPLVAAQVLLVGVPVAIVTALFRTVEPESPSRLTITDPAPLPRPVMHATAILLAFALVASVGPVLVPVAAAAAEPTVFLTVNNVGDRSDAAAGDGTCEVSVGVGDCTLRAAIDEANATAVGPVGIDFDFAGAAWITVGSTLEVTASVEINGANQVVTVSGGCGGDCSGPATQIFRFTSTVDPFAVANLTLHQGLGGATGGGAIEATSPAPGSILANVTFNENESAASGGAVAIHGGTLTIQNATFYANHSGGAGNDIHNTGDTTVLFSTFLGAGLGGTSAIDSPGSLMLGSSIVGSDAPGCVGVDAGLANLDRDGTCPGATPLGTFSGLLANHGGSVDTQPIGYASRAIDRGDASQCAAIGLVDARGVTRPVHDACDIGAYEYDGTASTVTVDVTTTSPSDLGADVEVTATVRSNEELVGGNVTFSKGGVDLDTVALVNGSATHTASGLASGSHTFDVDFDGDGGLLPESFGSVDHEVSTPSSSVVMSTDPAPSLAGDDVVVTATIDAGGAVAEATGTVTFTQDGVPLVPVDVVDGAASYTATGLDVGPHSIDASYSGDVVYPGSVGSVVHDVSVPGTHVILTAEPSPSLLGSTVDLTATISAPGVSVVPDGTVTFFDGTTDLGTADVIGGIARLSTSALAAGARSLTVEYSGDGVFPAAVSAPTPHAVQAPSSVGLVAPSSNSVYGESAMFLAVVSTDPALAPDGEVVFLQAGVEVHRTPVSEIGIATYSTSTLSVGDHPLVARYEGDALVLPGESPTRTHTVDPAATTVTLQSSTNPSAAGQPVTFTADVTTIAPGSGTPTGVVRFSLGGNLLGAGPVDDLGQAEVVVTDLPVGTATIRADFVADESFLDDSDELTQGVFAALTETALSSERNPSRLGESLKVTATVTVVAPGTGTPTGLVRFRDGAAVLGDVPLTAGGSATLDTTALAVGSHLLTAEYVGTSDFASSTSTPALEQQIDTWATTTTLTWSPLVPVSGQPVTFTAVVTEPSSSGYTTSGTVTFSGFGLSTPVEAVVDEFTGTATVTVPAPLGRGAGFTQSIHANYNGSLELGPSEDSASLRVDPGAIDVVLDVTPADPYLGQSVEITATVGSVSPATGTPTGVFEIFDGSTRIRRIEGTGGVTTTVGTSSVGSPGSLLGPFRHSLTVRFTATGWVTTTSDSASIDIRRVPTTLELRADPNPSVVDRQVTLTATMTVPPGAEPPLGENVSFYDDGDLLGSAQLRNVAPGPDPVYEAELTSTLTTIGNHLLTAGYRGPNHLDSTSPELGHEVLRRQTTITVGGQPTRPGEPIVIGVSVFNTFGSASPTGTVNLVRDGDLVAAATTLSATATGRSGATFTLPGDLGSGTYEYRTVYVPNGDFAGGEATFDHSVSAYLSTVSLDVASNTVEWGRSIHVSAAVTTSSVANPSAPTGDIVVSDGDGTSCLMAASGGTCTLSWDTPGDRSLVATYAGDGRYSPAASLRRDVQVIRRVPDITASITPAAPVTGDPATLQWTVVGATGGVAHGEIAGIRCDGGPVDSCVGTFPLSSAGVSQAATVVFDGDALYGPTSWTGSATPVGCHRLDLSLIPDTDGTIAATPAPNCNDGTGYVAGTAARVTVSPGDAGFGGAWDGVDWSGVGYTSGYSLEVVVGTGGNRLTRLEAGLRRRWSCFTVDWLHSETTPNPVRDVGGALRVAETPNCPVDANGASVSSPGWELVEGGQRGRFLVGTVLHTKPEVFPGMEFFGYRYGGPETIVDDDLLLQAVFGPVCLDVELVIEGPGTPQPSSPPTCANPLTGFSGHIVGSVVELTVEAERGAYLAEWQGADDRAGTEREVNKGFSSGGYVPQWTTTMTVAREPAVQTVTAVMTTCTRISVDPVLPTHVEERTASGGVLPGLTSLFEIVRSRDGDCPTDSDAELYRRGKAVEFEAQISRGTFGRWGYVEDASDNEPSVWVSTDEDVELRPLVFDLGEGCGNLEVRVATGTAGLVSTSEYDPVYCLAKTLGDGPATRLEGQVHESITLHGTATEGDPLLGWSFRDGWTHTGVAGATVELPVGYNDDIVAEMAACTAIVPEVTLQYPGGATETGGAPPGFVQLADPDLVAPDCPFDAGSGAWRVGSNTVLAPLVAPGYDFDHWEGDLDHATVQSNGWLKLDFTTPRSALKVRAVYNVRCVDLTLRNSEHIISSPAPNCMPTGDRETATAPNAYSGRYITGTTVYLQGSVAYGDLLRPHPDAIEAIPFFTLKGEMPTSTKREVQGKIWTGWTGDVVDAGKYQNPLTVPMDQDRTIGFSYRDRTTGEKFEDFGESFVDTFAELGRKAVGFAGMFTEEALTGTISAGLGMLGGVSAALNAMGVGVGSLDTFIAVATQTMEFLTSTFGCAAEWGLGNGLNPPPEDSPLGTEGGAVVDGIGDQMGNADLVLRTLYSGAELGSGGDLLAARRAMGSSLAHVDDGLGKLGTAATVLQVGLTVWDITQNGGWSDDPIAAWSNADVYNDCLEDRFPDFTGLPPASYEAVGN